MVAQEQQSITAGRFTAMASPCEVIVSGVEDTAILQQITKVVADEAWRIESLWSRYQRGNIVAQINRANGLPVTVDEETARFLDYAQNVYRWSDGLFDITSGVLRRVWKFDGSSRVPSEQQIAELMPLVGWHRVRWESPVLQMPEGMEIDFGGIGKEYAVDRALALVTARWKYPVLVNFGGDLAASGPRIDGSAWNVGIDAPGHDRSQGLSLHRGAIASSGDAHRYLLKDGVRYSHILNPRTGNAIVGAPRTVTVRASTCTEAGVISTMALLHGKEAETFLANLEADSRVWW